MTSYIHSKCNSSEALTMLSSQTEPLRISDVDTTLTDSFLDVDKLDISDVLAVDSSFCGNDSVN